MNIVNENVPFEFLHAFQELVRQSTLNGRTGTIVLSMDWTTLETCVAFGAGAQAAAPKPVARGKTPNDVFTQVLAAVEPPPMPTSLPEALEHPGPGQWWWLCFCDPARPEGQQFLGVAVVEGATLRHAMNLAQELGINPGGKVASVACTLYVPAPRWRNRLLTRQEVVAAGNDVQRAE